MPSVGSTLVASSFCKVNQSVNESINHSLTHSINQSNNQSQPVILKRFSAPAACRSLRFQSKSELRPPRLAEHLRSAKRSATLCAALHTSELRDCCCSALASAKRCPGAAKMGGKTSSSMEKFMRVVRTTHDSQLHKESQTKLKKMMKPDHAVLVVLHCCCFTCNSN